MAFQSWNHVPFGTSPFGCGAEFLDVSVSTGYPIRFSRRTSNTANLYMEYGYFYYSWGPEKFLPTYRAYVDYDWKTTSSGWNHIIDRGQTWAGYQSGVCMYQTFSSGQRDYSLYISEADSQFSTRWRFGDNYEAAWDTDYYTVTDDIPMSYRITPPKNLRYSVSSLGMTSISVTATIDDYQQGNINTGTYNSSINGKTCFKDGYGGGDGRNWTWQIVIRTGSPSGPIAKTVNLDYSSTQPRMVSETISGLNANTQYFVQVVVSNNYQSTASLNNQSATTLSSAIPNRLGEQSTMTNGVPTRKKVLGGLKIWKQDFGKIRYIKNGIAGSSANTSSHWVQIQAFATTPDYLTESTSTPVSQTIGPGETKTYNVDPTRQVTWTTNPMFVANTFYSLADGIMRKMDWTVPFESVTSVPGNGQTLQPLSGVGGTVGTIGCGTIKITNPTGSSITFNFAPSLARALYLTTSSKNVALGKTVTYAGNAMIDGTNNNPQVITDGTVSSSKYFGVSSTPAVYTTVTVDLAGLYEVDTIKIWHYYTDGRTYNQNTLTVGPTSATGTGDLSTVLFKADQSTLGGYNETSAGKTIPVKTGIQTQRKQIILPHSPGKVDNCIKMKIKTDKDGNFGISWNQLNQTHDWLIYWGDGKYERASGSVGSSIPLTDQRHDHVYGLPFTDYEIIIVPYDLTAYGWFYAFGGTWKDGPSVGYPKYCLCLREIKSQFHAKMLQKTKTEVTSQVGILASSFVGSTYLTGTAKFAQDFTWQKIGNSFLESAFDGTSMNLDLSGLAYLRIAIVGFNFLKAVCRGTTIFDNGVVVYQGGPRTPINLTGLNTWPVVSFDIKGFMSNSMDTAGALTTVSDFSQFNTWTGAMASDTSMWQFGIDTPFNSVYSGTNEIKDISGIKIPVSFRPLLLAQSTKNFFNSSFRVSAAGGTGTTGAQPTWSDGQLLTVSYTPTARQFTFTNRTGMTNYASINTNWK